MKKTLTRRQAWLALMVKWQNARPMGLGLFPEYVEYVLDGGVGICPTIGALRNREQITESTARRMREEIEALLVEKERSEGFFFDPTWRNLLAPKNAEGAQYRALVCAFLATMPKEFRDTV